jgi:ABC-type nickel/cobalt efflux system permease component RcnA
MEIDPYALLLLFVLVFAMGGVVGLALGAWAMKHQREQKKKWAKKYEEEHAKKDTTPPPP